MGRNDARSGHAYCVRKAYKDSSTGIEYLELFDPNNSTFTDNKSDFLLNGNSPSRGIVCAPFSEINTKARSGRLFVCHLSDTLKETARKAADFQPGGYFSIKCEQATDIRITMTMDIERCSRGKSMRFALAAKKKSGVGFTILEFPNSQEESRAYFQDTIAETEIVSLGRNETYYVRPIGETSCVSHISDYLKKTKFTFAVDHTENTKITLKYHAPRDGERLIIEDKHRNLLPGPLRRDATEKCRKSYCDKTFNDCINVIHDTKNKLKDIPEVHSYSKDFEIKHNDIYYEICEKKKDKKEAATYRLILEERKPPAEYGWFKTMLGYGTSPVSWKLVRFWNWLGYDGDTISNWYCVKFWGIFGYETNFHKTINVELDDDDTLYDMRIREKYDPSKHIDKVQS